MPRRSIRFKLPMGSAVAMGLGACTGLRTRMHARALGRVRAGRHPRARR